MFSSPDFRNRVANRTTFRAPTTAAATLAAVSVVVPASPLWATPQHERPHRKPSAAAQKPARHAAGDYLAQYGKKTAWASEIGAPCPAGRP